MRAETTPDVPGCTREWWRGSPLSLGSVAHAHPCARGLGLLPVTVVTKCRKPGTSHNRNPSSCHPEAEGPKSRWQQSWLHPQVPGGPFRPISASQSSLQPVSVLSRVSLSFHPSEDTSPSQSRAAPSHLLPPTKALCKSRHRSCLSTQMDTRRIWGYGRPATDSTPRVSSRALSGVLASSEVGGAVSPPPTGSIVVWLAPQLP